MFINDTHNYVRNCKNTSIGINPTIHGILDMLINVGPVSPIVLCVFVVGFTVDEKDMLHPAIIQLSIRRVALSTQHLRESADGSLVQQSVSSTQSFAH